MAADKPSAPLMPASGPRPRAVLQLVGAVAVLAVAALGIVSYNTEHTEYSELLQASNQVARQQVRDVRHLSPAHRQMLARVKANRKAIFTMLGCECTDISKIWQGDNIWGHYTPKCCDKSSRKNSVGNVLKQEMGAADAGTKSLEALLESAETKLDKKLSVIVDAVTLKNGGRPGPRGPRGKKGPQGYAGPPGSQGPRGPPGLQGIKGPQGHPGQKGFRGPTGRIGNKGEQGYVGTPGPPGYIGPIGKRGVLGGVGPPGPLGPPGPPGNEGGMGRVGDPGSMGPQGGGGGVRIFTGYKAETPCNTARWHNNQYLDRHHVTCRHKYGNSFLYSFYFNMKRCVHSNMQYNYKCVWPGTWKKCADENGTCKCNGMVRFGKGNRWSNGRNINGSIRCNVGNFGDPWRYKPKTCECAIGKADRGCRRVQGSCQATNGYRLMYLDRQRVMCNSDELLSSFHQGWYGCHNPNQRTVYHCCKPARGVDNCYIKHSGCTYTGWGQTLHRLHYAGPVQCNEDNFEGIQTWQFTRAGCPWRHHRYQITCCRIK